MGRVVWVPEACSALRSSADGQQALYRCEAHVGGEGGAKLLQGAPHAMNVGNRSDGRPR